MWLNVLCRTPARTTIARHHLFDGTCSYFGVVIYLGACLISSAKDDCDFDHKDADYCRADNATRADGYGTCVDDCTLLPQLIGITCCALEMRGTASTCACRDNPSCSPPNHATTRLFSRPCSAFVLLYIFLDLARLCPRKMPPAMIFIFLYVKMPCFLCGQYSCAMYGLRYALPSLARCVAIPSRAAE